MTDEALIDFCVDEMAAYKRPRWIEFVDELPKTATGKIQRFKLRSVEPHVFRPHLHFRPPGCGNTIRGHDLRKDF